MRQLRETGDRAMIASRSVPLPVFDRNQGNVAAARSGMQSAEARRNSVLANKQAEIANARATALAAETRKNVVTGKGVSVRVDLGGRRNINKKKIHRTRSKTTE